MRDLVMIPNRKRSFAHALWGAHDEHVAGVFTIISPIDRAEMHVIATSGDGWDHVSVSRKNRCPNWREMDYVKRVFFSDDEVAMQLHVQPRDHVNIHPNCLHLWRPTDQGIHLPPSIFV